MSVAAVRGDARRLPLPDGSVDLIVTSPPYEVLAYLAGIIDADGCIRVSKDRPTRDRVTPGYHARVHVRMVERAAVDLLGATFGGSIWTHRPTAPRGRKLNVWDVSDVQAQRALEQLLPYLRIKRPQAENALALRRLRAESHRHRTKVIGQKTMTGQYGQQIITPITCLSDDFVSRCDSFYLRSRALNQVGMRGEVGGECL